MLIESADMRVWSVGIGYMPLILDKGCYEEEIVERFNLITHLRKIKKQ